MLNDAIDEVPYVADAVEIGRGGFATVHRVEDLLAGRQVAVKLLSLRSDDLTLKYFDRERKTLSRLSTHPNVVTLHRTGVTTGGVPYLVMELASGGSLAERLKADGAFVWSEAVDWIVPICRALELAHGQGIRHRDIKPQNILISDHGQPLLSDFGIAGLAAGTETITQRMKLSLSYASPEQIDGRELDDTTDVYSLGATLYTLIVGNPPFRDTDGTGFLSTAKRIIEERPPLLDETVPAHIRDAVAAAMAKNPAYRPTAAEFREALVGERRLEPPPPGDELPALTIDLNKPPASPGHVSVAADADDEVDGAETFTMGDGDPIAPASEAASERRVVGAAAGPARWFVLAAAGLLLVVGLAAAARSSNGGDEAAREEEAALTPDDSDAAGTASVGDDDGGSVAGPSGASSSGGDGSVTTDSLDSGSADGDESQTEAAAGGETDGGTVVVESPSTTTADGDRDGTGDGVDNCPEVANQDQRNTDGDGFGDVCDTDDDNDGVLDTDDNCGLITNADQEDVDGGRSRRRL